MSTVTVTGNAWTHQGAPIHASRHPELWFRPRGHAIGTVGLLVGVEVQATLDASTGAFSVELETGIDLQYQPVMRWLTNPTEQDPVRWAYAYAEWKFWVVPGEGGTITDLINNFPPGQIIVALEPPLPGVMGVTWIDLSDQTADGAQVYAPAGS